MLDLSYLLSGNELLASYIIDSNITINNFLRGKISQDTYDRAYVFNDLMCEITDYPNESEEDLKRYIQSKGFRDFVRSGHLLLDTLPYNPITPEYVKMLMELDAVMRASKAWNTKPMTIYRGCKNFDGTSLSEIISATSKKDIAFMHAVDFKDTTGTILKINIPANFPYLIPNNCLKFNAFDYESEFLLPPCDVEVVKSDPINDPDLKKYMDSDFKVKMLEVNLYPKSIAKVFLKKMKQKPANFPQEFIDDPFFQYTRARNMLQTYVKNYVERNKIPLMNKTIQERKTQPYQLINN